MPWIPLAPFVFWSVVFDYFRQGYPKKSDKGGQRIAFGGFVGPLVDVVAEGFDHQGVELCAGEAL